jgi:hypothetical protein
MNEMASPKSQGRAGMLGVGGLDCGRRGLKLGSTRVGGGKTVTSAPAPAPPPPSMSTTSTSGSVELASIPSNFDVASELVPAWGNGAIPVSGAPDVVGAFRFICNPAHLAKDDPIVTRTKLASRTCTSSSATPRPVPTQPMRASGPPAGAHAIARSTGQHIGCRR